MATSIKSLANGPPELRVGMARHDRRSAASLPRLVRAMTVVNVAGTPTLYIAGEFNYPLPSGRTLVNVGRWNGDDFVEVGDWRADLGLQFRPAVIAGFDTADGMQVFVLASYPAVGNSSLGGVAYQVVHGNGARWQKLPPASTGVEFFNFSDTPLNAFDDGFGPLLYYVRIFRPIPGQGEQHWSRWDGAAWQTLPQDVNNEWFAIRRNLLPARGASGSALIIGGDWNEGAAVRRLFRWSQPLTPCLP